MGKKWNSDRLYFLGLQNHCGHCSHEIKRCLLLARKPRQCISREIALLTKVHLDKTMVFPVVMYRCESWTIKKAECQRIDTFELWCWRRLLRVPWTARRSNQSVLKEISPDFSLEGLMLKLKLQHFGHLMWRTDSFEKILILGKIEGRRRRGQQRMRWLDGITDYGHEFEQALGVGDGHGGLVCWSPWCGRVRHNWQLNNNDGCYWKKHENLYDISQNICF